MQDFSNNEKNLLIELLCKEQINAIHNNANGFESERYKLVEGLKIKIKNI